MRDGLALLATFENEPSAPGHARPSSRARRRRTRRRRLITTGVATVAVLAIAGSSYALTRSGGTQYRTTAVGTGTVNQSVDATGTVSSVNSDDASFSVAGTVDKVKVQVGDTVKAGQLLATLNKADLKESVTSAQTTLTQAKQQLADDLDAQADDTSSSTTGSSASTDAEDSAWTSSGSSSASDATYVEATTTATTTQDVASKPSRSPAGPSSATSTGKSSKSSSTTGSDVDAARAAVESAQTTLMDDYDSAQKLLTSSELDLTTASGDVATVNDAQEACATFLAASDSSSGSSTATGAPTDGSTSGSSTDSDTATALKQCQAAIAKTSTDQSAVDAAQQAVDGAQKQLQADATTLDNAVDELTKAVSAEQSSTGTGSTSTAGSGSTGSKPGSGSSSKAGSGSTGSKLGSGSSSKAGSGQSGSGSASGFTGSAPSGANGSTGSKSGSGSTGSGSPSYGSGKSSTGSGGGDSTGSSGSQGSGAQTTTITAAQILADRAAVDEDQARLQITQDDASRSQLTSTIAGQVADVAITAGSSVSASSSSDIITVLGKGGHVVQATVPLTDVTLLKTGQKASVDVAGYSKKLDGTVSSIGIVNESSDSTPSYDVSVALTDTSTTLYDGSSAQMTVAVASAKNATVVPTSAVTTSGKSHTVRVLKDGKPQTVSVDIGAMGPELTQITSGLDVGEHVVLADLSQAVTSGSSSSSKSGLSGIGGSTTGAPGSFGGTFGGGSFGGAGGGRG